jgi:hypothetical protein
VKPYPDEIGAIAGIVLGIVLLLTLETANRILGALFLLYGVVNLVWAVWFWNYRRKNPWPWEKKSGS